MITSDKQYAAAKGKLAMLEEALVAPRRDDVPLALIEVAQGQTHEMAEELKGEIAEYEMLKNTHPVEIPIHSLDDLMLAPIRYRIAANMTVEEFARRVDIHSRQIARYEAERYRNTTTATLQKILGKLDLNVSGYLKVA
jgi:hypothetical protein